MRCQEALEHDHWMAVCLVATHSEDFPMACIPWQLPLTCLCAHTHTLPPQSVCPVLPSSLPPSVLLLPSLTFSHQSPSLHTPSFLTHHLYHHQGLGVLSTLWHKTHDPPLPPVPTLCPCHPSSHSLSSCWVLLLAKPVLNMAASPMATSTIP